MLTYEQFKFVFFIICLFVIITLAFTIFYSKKKGVNVEGTSFQLIIGLGGLLICTSIFWFVEDISITVKIEATGVAFFVGLIKYFAVDKYGKKFRRLLDIETEQDKERDRHKL